MGAARRGGTLASIIGAVVLVAAIVLAVATTSAPAGNRDPEAALFAYPGPEEATYGQNVAYTATLFNDDKSQFTHAVYTHTKPTTVLDGETVTSELVYASCDDENLSLGTFTATDYSCPPTTIPAGDTARVTLVWTTPRIPEPLTCDADDPAPATPVNDCELVSEGQWTIKEGTGKQGSAGPDTFPEDPIPITTPLHGDDDDPQAADGYVLDALDCSGSNVAIQTFEGTLGPGNAIVTKVCPSTVPTPAISVFSPGLLIKILEGGTGIPPGLEERVTDTAFVCIPAPDPLGGFGNNCPAALGYGPPHGTPGYTAWSFAPQAKFSFVIDNGELLVNGEQIDQVFHDGVDVTEDCTITIDHPAKKTFVSCFGDANGGWDFG
ncbi:MAG: hypothetical protein ACRDNY_12520 [Gaiellaceae bacterium]